MNQSLRSVDNQSILIMPIDTSSAVRRQDGELIRNPQATRGIHSKGIKSQHLWNEYEVAYGGGYDCPW